MTSLIDTNTLHPSMAERKFKYAEMVDVDSPDGELKPTHQILSKLEAKGSKWQILGNENGALVYPTKEDAVADVKKLNDWKNDQGSSAAESGEGN